MLCGWRVTTFFLFGGSVLYMLYSLTSFFLSSSPPQGLGDSETLQLPDTSVNNINGVCTNMPCLVVLVAGRPVSTSKWLENVDGLVMAWLPGTEGAGVADVILREHEFTGSLPVTWFSTIEDLPTNKAPLFDVGFGLTKASSDVVQREF